MQPISTIEPQWFIPPQFDRATAEADLAAARQARDDARAADPQADLAPHDRAIAALEALLGVIDANRDKVGERVPRFLIRAGSLWDRAEWRRRCNALAFYPTDLRLIETARTIVSEAAPANLAALLALLDEAQAKTLAGAALDDEPAAALEDLFRSLERAPDFADLMAARRKYGEVAPLVAAQMLVVGWENICDEAGAPVPFARRAGLIPDATLEALPAELLHAAGAAAYHRLFLPRSAEKNSRSPSSPRSSLNGSTAPMSTDGAGASSAATTADSRVSS